MGLAHTYGALLDNASHLPPAVLRAAYAYALDQDNRSLLRRIVAREDAPADLVAQFATLTDTTLVGVFAARNTHFGHRRVESRADVLARAIRDESSNPEAVADALDAFDAKPTRVLADALLRKPATWFTPEQAYRIWSGAGAPPDNLQGGHMLRLAARLGPQWAATLLAQTKELGVCRQMSELDVGVEELLAATARSCIDAGWDARGYFGPTERDTDYIIGRVLARGWVPDEVHRVLLRELAELAGDEMAAAPWFPKVSGGLLRPVQPVARFVVTPWDLTPANPPRTGTLNVRNSSVMRALAASSDPALLHEAAQALAAHPRDWCSLTPVTTALWNPRLSVDDRHALLRAIVVSGSRVADFDHLDVVAMFPTDPQAIALWAAWNPAQVLNAHGWEPFGGRKQAPAVIANLRQHMEQSPDGLSPWARDTLTAIVNQGPQEEELLAMTPAMLNSTWDRAQISPAAAALLASRLANLLDTHLRTQQEWQVYTVLEPNFAGTLGELLNNTHTILD